MKRHSQNKSEDKSFGAAHSTNKESSQGFIDNRTEATTQRAVQNAMQSGVAQFWPVNGAPKDKYSDSSFQSTQKLNTTIYMLYDSDSQEEDVEYVGKTVQQGNARFLQHKKEKKLGPNIKSEKLRDESWTPFETATHEQYWIGEAGGKQVLVNKINALTQEKWNWFKEPTPHGINKDQESELTSGHF